MPDLVHRRLRAPQVDGAALIDPPLAAFRGMVERNRSMARNSSATVNDKSLEEFKRAARADFLSQAISFTSEYRNVSGLPTTMHHAPFIVAGHQPELFHPGVWFKNFLLSVAGERSRGIAINLIVDTDTARSTTIRVPLQENGQASIENVAFDASGNIVPFEERPILDPWLFETFGRRVMDAYATCCIGGREPYEKLVEPLWKAASAYKKVAGSGVRLGLTLARARHWLEWQFGLRTLELPLSTVSQSRHFQRFAVHLLAQATRLRQIYNSALAEYRAVNHIRSGTHPVPSLQRDDDWLEAPFLLWTKENPRRQRLFVLPLRDSLVLCDRQGRRIMLDLPADGSVDKAVGQLAAAESRGIKLRPRALITTMYARLVLSDLFIHGIGGAKYDELTDLIIRRFFGIEPPAYVTATATFRLPIERPQVSLEDVRQSARRIREARYRPEAFLRDPRVKQDAALAEQLTSLAAEKREYLAKHDLRHCSQEVFAALERLNRAMHDLLRPAEAHLRAEHATLIELWKQTQLLSSREFSFCLFPSEILPARLLDLCKVSS
jgi:hypothetical protein